MNPTARRWLLPSCFGRFRATRDLKASPFFAVGLFLLLLAACSEPPPSPAVVQAALRHEIESASEGQIKLVSFAKTDGQKFAVNGVPGYIMDYEAEIEFARSGSWLTAGNFGRLAFGFSTSVPPSGTMAGFLNQTVEGGKPVQRGMRVKIIGSMTGEKKESGWKFQSIQSQISAGIADNPAPGPARTTPAFVACINNLRLIDSAKQQWALEQRKINTDTPDASDLLPYLGRGQGPTMPRCAAGEEYSINAINNKPTCSIPGHVLP